MASILRLFVHSRIPIGVIEDDITSSCKIESYSPRPSTRDEAEYPRVVVEALDDGLPELGLGVSVETHVVELEHIEHLLEDV
jgi:hypothetical protein